MKIILIGPSSPLRGGIANFNDSLYKALEKMHDPYVIGFSRLYPPLLFPGKSQYENRPSFSYIRGKNLINSTNPLTWRTTAREIVRMKPDCLLVQYWMPFFAPAYGYIIRHAKKRTGLKVIGVLHNIDPHEKMPGALNLNRFFLKSCDGFITMSSKVLEDLRKTGIDKPAKMVPHPVYDIFGDPVSKNDACDHLGLDPDQKYLLFFGLIRNYKGLGLLIKAMSKGSINHLNLKLLVAGEFYEDEKKYRNMVKELGLEERIIFTEGFVPKEEVGYYFSASDLVILPYLSATQSGVTQIAYHFNKPVLVTDVGGLQEVVFDGRTGYVCKKDPEEIAGSIADFFDNKKSAEFIQNIKNEKYRFSWDNMVQGIEILAEEI